MIAGEKCPVCGKGKLRKALDEPERGIKVEAFRCSKCSETFYAQDVMEKIEAIQKMHAEERRLVRIGNSLAAIIPSKIAKKMGLKEKEKVLIEESKGVITIRAPVR